MQFFLAAAFCFFIFFLQNFGKRKNQLNHQYGIYWSELQFFKDLTQKEGGSDHTGINCYWMHVIDDKYHGWNI